MSEENETTLDTSTDTTEQTNDTDVNTRLAKLEEELKKRDGSIKRLKTKLGKLSEVSDDDTETEKKEKPEEKNSLLEKAFLRSAGITDKEEVELALATAKKWNVEIDELVDDDDWTEKLEKHRTKKANLEAVSGVKGDKSGSSAKEDPAYWISKGTPPTADQVPDKKARVKIARAMMSNAKEGKKFYND